MRGHLKKMHSLLDSPVQYRLILGDETVELNTLINTPLKLIHTKQIQCIHCKRSIKKTYNQGYCYPCFISLAECDMCIVKPHLCHYAAGTCRDASWGDEFCNQPHIVYLANSSHLKVGITRHSQIPTRWIDQGANQALPIFKSRSRHIAGLIEIAISQHISDKTHWQKMLKSDAETIDLIAYREQLVTLCQQELCHINETHGNDAFELLSNDTIVEIRYPIEQYPTKIKALDFDKSPEIIGTLLGIKGQYLLLDSGVLNIRKYTGYEIELS